MNQERNTTLLAPMRQAKIREDRFDGQLTQVIVYVSRRSKTHLKQIYL